jgi:hypothetical protein
MEEIYNERKSMKTETNGMWIKNTKECTHSSSHKLCDQRVSSDPVFEGHTPNQCLDKRRQVER